MWVKYFLFYIKVVLFFIWGSFIIMLYNLYELYFMLSDISFYVMWCKIELIVIKKKNLCEYYVRRNFKWNVMWMFFLYDVYDIFIWNLL